MTLFFHFIERAPAVLFVAWVAGALGWVVIYRNLMKSDKLTIQSLLVLTAIMAALLTLTAACFRSITL